MSPQDIDELIRKGIEAAEKGYIHSAQVFLGQAAEHQNTPQLHTYLAYCQARSQGRMATAAKTCRESIRLEPDKSLHYLILGRVLLMSGDKEKAIESFREGLLVESNPRIIEELKKLGLRKPAVLRSLERSHPLNRMLGIMLHRIGLR